MRKPRQLEVSCRSFIIYIGLPPSSREGLGVGLFYTIPCAIMALATFMKPATLAPFT